MPGYDFSDVSGPVTSGVRLLRLIPPKHFVQAERESPHAASSSAPAAATEKTRSVAGSISLELRLPSWRSVRRRREEVSSSGVSLSRPGHLRCVTRAVQSWVRLE
jgi:hypothetical protein